MVQTEPDLWFYKATHPGSVHLCECVCSVHGLQAPIYIDNHIISILKMYMLTNSYYLNLKGPKVKVLLTHYLILEEEKKIFQSSLLFFF